MVNKSIIIKSNKGLDATPIARIVQEAGNFNSAIYLKVDGKKINAKSIMGMMTLTLVDGVTLEVVAEGDDEQVAVESLSEYIANLCV